MPDLDPFQIWNFARTDDVELKFGKVLFDVNSR